MRIFNKLLYGMKSVLGVKAYFYSVEVTALNLETGERNLIKTRIKLHKVVIVPVRVIKKIAIPKNINYVAGDRFLITDEISSIDKNDYFVIKERRYSIIDWWKLNNDGYVFHIRNIQGPSYLEELDLDIQNQISDRISSVPILPTLTNFAPVRDEPWEDHVPIGGFEWNTNCWAYGLNFTGMGSWCRPAVPPNPASHWYLATLISPRHVITAKHCGIEVGHIIYFIRADGSVYEATVQSYAFVRLYASQYGFRIAYLTEDVPSDICYYKTLPSDYNDLFTFNETTWDPSYFWLKQNITGKPTLYMDRERKAAIGYIGGTSDTTKPHVDAILGVYKCEYYFTNRAAYWESLLQGDSGSPSFMLINNELVLLGVHFQAPLSYSYVDHCAFGVNSYTAINSAMATLEGVDGSGYQLEVVQL